MEEVGAKETDIEDRKIWRMMIQLKRKPLTEEKGRKKKNCCENKWINYLKAKININIIFFSYNWD